MDETTAPARMTVAEVADLAGVTVRTLHHYDRIGLLVPHERSDAEYRLYGPRDVARLREILVWRRLGLSLAEIARLLDDPAADRAAVLRAQRELVRTRQEELVALAAALDRAIEREDAEDGEMDQEIIDALGGFDPREHEAEAEARWGDTEAYRESARRTKQYTPDDWRRIRDEGAAIEARLAELFAAGEPPTGDAALELAEQWRAHVSRWFYECSPAMLRALGEMYVADPRFTAHYDGADGERAGFAAWVREAWVARADRG